MQKSIKKFTKVFDGNIGIGKKNELTLNGKSLSGLLKKSWGEVSGPVIIHVIPVNDYNGMGYFTIKTEHSTLFAVVEETFWKKHQMVDTEANVKLPSGFDLIMPSVFCYHGSDLIGERILQHNGFKKLKNKVSQ